MSRRKITFPVMGAPNLAGVAVLMVVLLRFSAFASAQKATSTSSKWQTLDGSSPLVIARGGLSGLFPDSSPNAYKFAMATSVSDLVLWCDVQLTKDGAGICFPNLMLDNGSDIATAMAYPKRGNTYTVDGTKTSGYFPIDFTLRELASVHLQQGLAKRFFDDYLKTSPIQTVEDVFTQNQPFGFWLNVQHDAFYSQHKLSMRSFVISASKSVIISHISSPEVSFLRGLVRPFASTKTKLVFRFLDQDLTEPSTNQTYGSLLKNLTFIKSFASGILVPKSYIWPVDALYLLPHTSLVADAHKNGLAVFASDFANDNVLAYNYSFNPVTEYLSFIDNGNFAVDGVLSDFPITPSAARDCFAHLGKNASAQAKPLVISNFGASGDLPGCTDLAYTKAIADGADVIDCPVQISKDGVPFCSSSVDLMNSTLITQTQFRNLLSTVSEIQSTPGIYSFSLNWADIQGLTPVISNPFPASGMPRNPKFRTAGKLISFSDFLVMAKNATSLSGVSIKIEYASYLAANQGLSVTDTILDALDKAGYNGPTAKKVMIQSTDSAVLKAMKGKKYELVYEVEENIRGASNATIADIKSFADSVVVSKQSVFAENLSFLLGLTDVVSNLQSFKLAVYVQTFNNEFVSIPYDFFSDPIVEINSYVMGPGIDGVITAYPRSAVAYKRNRCLKSKIPPPYMSPVQPGGLITLAISLPPAPAPNPLLSDSDVVEAPLPAVAHNASTLPVAEAPKHSPSGQQQITASALLSSLALIAVVALL